MQGSAAENAAVIAIITVHKQKIMKYRECVSDIRIPFFERMAPKAQFVANMVFACVKADQ